MRCARCAIATATPTCSAPVLRPGAASRSERCTAQGSGDLRTPMATDHGRGDEPARDVHLCGARKSRRCTASRRRPAGPRRRVRSRQFHQLLRGPTYRRRVRHRVGPFGADDGARRPRQQLRPCGVHARRRARPSVQRQRVRRGVLLCRAASRAGAARHPPRDGTGALAGRSDRGDDDLRSRVLPGAQGTRARRRDLRGAGLRPHHRPGLLRGRRPDRHRPATARDLPVRDRAHAGGHALPPASEASAPGPGTSR